jgi:hypothetical protein
VFIYVIWLKTEALMVLTWLVQTNSESFLRTVHFSEIVVQAGLDVQQVTSMVVMFVM